MNIFRRKTRSEPEAAGTGSGPAADPAADYDSFLQRLAQGAVASAIGGCDEELAARVSAISRRYARHQDEQLHRQELAEAVADYERRKKG